MTATKVRKYRNKFIAPIPKELVNEYRLEPGDYLDLDFVGINQPNSKQPKIKMIVKSIIRKHTA